MAASRGGEFRHQDGHILLGTHAQESWDERAPEEWRGFPVLSAWAEGDLVESPYSVGASYTRLHDPSGMLIIAQWGFIHTAVPQGTYVRGGRS